MRFPDICLCFQQLQLHHLHHLSIYTQNIIFVAANYDPFFFLRDMFVEFYNVTTKRFGDCILRKNDVEFIGDIIQL